MVIISSEFGVLSIPCISSNHITDARTEKSKAAVMLGLDQPSVDLLALKEVLGLLYPRLGVPAT